MPKPASKRTVMRVIRLTTEEDKIVKAQAKMAGLSISAYMRASSLRRGKTAA